MQKRVNKRTRKQAREWDKFLTKDMSDKRLVFNLYGTLKT